MTDELRWKNTLGESEIFWGGVTHERDKGEDVVKGRLLLKHHTSGDRREDRPEREGDLRRRKRLLIHQSAFIAISSKSYQTSLSRVQLGTPRA